MEGKIGFIVAMMLATYPVRLVPLIALSERSLPDLLVRWLRYVPVAVFSAMVFPSVLLRDNSIAAGPGNPYIWAGAATFLVAAFTRNLSKSVLAGIAVALAGEFLLR
ncbi:MAG TPA: AzlD domain-containing protein [Chloroflexota bacterium]